MNKRVGTHILTAVFLGLVPSCGSFSIAWAGISTVSESVILQIGAWNYFAAAKLSTLGILPVCLDCELLTLLEVMFWGFVLDWIVYSAILLVILYIRRTRTDS